MANKEFESYLVGITKKYMQDHPESKLTVTKKIEVPVNECEYCSENAKPIFEIPFSDTCIKVEADKISVSCSCGYKVAVKCNYCPKCGRKIANDC